MNNFVWRPDERRTRALKMLYTWRLPKGAKSYTRTPHNGEFEFSIDEDLLAALQLADMAGETHESQGGCGGSIEGSFFCPATTFVNRQLTGFDTRKIEHFRATALPRKNWSYNIRNPQRIGKGRRYWKNFYKIRMGLNPKQMFPLAEKIAIGSYKTASDWGYEEVLVEFRSLDELFVFVAGAVSFRFLKHDKQFEGGRLGNPASNRFGLGWLKTFAGRDPFEVKGKHHHSIDDDFWVQNQ
jgi:hypothetical protein